MIARTIVFAAMVLAAMLGLCGAPATAAADNAITDVTVDVPSQGPGRPQWSTVVMAPTFGDLVPRSTSTWAATITVRGKAQHPCPHWEFDVSPGALPGHFLGASGSVAESSGTTTVFGEYAGGVNNPQLALTVTASCDALVRISKTITAYVDQPPFAATAPVPGRHFTQGFKDSANVAAAAGIIAGAVLLGVAATIATGGLAGGFAWAGVAALAGGIGGGALAFYDPPDSHYTDIAIVSPVKLHHQRLPCPKRVSASECRAVNRGYLQLFPALSRTLSVMRAEVVTNNRGATAADANDFDSQMLQIAVGKLYAPQLRDALRRQSRADHKFAVALRRARMDFLISGAPLRRALRRAERLSGLPPALDQELVRLLNPVGGINAGRTIIRTWETATHFKRPSSLRLSVALQKAIPLGGLTKAPATIGPIEAAEVNEALIRAGRTHGNLGAVRGDFVRWRESCDAAERAGALVRAQADSATTTGPGADLLKAAVAAATKNPGVGVGPAGCPGALRGPFLAWGGLGEGPGQMSEPTNLAVDAAGVYEADQGNQRVQQFTPNGTFVRAWGTPAADPNNLQPGEFVTPVGVATDSAGNVYVTDFLGERVQKFTADGKFLLTWGSDGSGPGQFYRTGDVAVDQHDDVYVVDPGNFRVQKFDASGNFLGQFGTQGSDDGQFSQPRGIAVGPDGNVYVADRVNNDIQVFGPDGTFLRRWGQPGTDGPGNFNGAYDVAVDPVGHVWVADYGNFRIQEFTSDGQYLGEEDHFGIGTANFEPIAIAVDSAFNLYVSDPTTARVLVFGNRRP